MEQKLERITTDRGADRLEADLARYCQLALDLGAEQAKVVSAADIVVDDRVQLKCQIPRCFGYGACAHCPPNTLKPSELRAHLANYQWAVLFTKNVAPSVIVRDRATIKERVDVYQEVSKIVTEVESKAFYDGHYHAFGFGAGSCRHTFCGQQPDCQALTGKKCRFALLARPSMEAVGIDVFQMVARAGWEIYPIGSNAKADDVPKGTLVGIVIVQ